MASAGLATSQSRCGRSASSSGHSGGYRIASAKGIAPPDDQQRARLGRPGRHDPAPRRRAAGPSRRRRNSRATPAPTTASGRTSPNCRVAPEPDPGRRAGRDDSRATPPFGRIAPTCPAATARRPASADDAGQHEGADPDAGGRDRAAADQGGSQSANGTAAGAGPGSGAHMPKDSRRRAPRPATLATGRAQERQDRERQQPEHEIARVDRNACWPTGTAS